MLSVNCARKGDQTGTTDDPQGQDTLDIATEILLPAMPSCLQESSGLILFKGLLWSMNDSGGEAAIYGFNSNTGEVIQTVYLTNGENIDWESLAADSHFIYIGDFGNNRGRRTDLVVYRLAKTDIPVEGDARVAAEQIRFSYPDQENFSWGMNNNPFDCEAFFSCEDRLLLFTKDWVTEQTKVYSLPVQPGSYTAELVDSLQVGGLITGADISPDNTRMVLVGYKDFNPFVWCFEIRSTDHLFSGKGTRYRLQDMFLAQTEGIAFSGNSVVYISAEQSQIPARLYRIILP